MRLPYFLRFGWSSDEERPLAFPREAVEGAIERALRHKGVLVTLTLRGLQACEEDVEAGLPHPILLDHPLSDFLDLDAGDGDLAVQVEEWGDRVFFGVLLEEYEAGRVPSPAEAVDLYLAYGDEEEGAA